MRLYHIVFRILFVLPIIDFAVAAPVLVQEKLQAGVDVMHIHEDAINMLGKRGDEFDEFLLKLFEDPGSHLFAKPGESAASRLLSPQTTPAGGWTDLKKPLTSIPEESSPPPSPAPSTANADPLMESSSSSTTSSMYAFLEDEWVDEGDYGLHGPTYTPTSLGYGSDDELTGVHAPQPSPNPRLPKDPDLDWNHRTNLEDPPSPEEFGQAHENQVEHALQPNQLPSTVSHVDWNRVWNDWFGSDTTTDGLLPSKKRLKGPNPVSSKEFGQAHENQVPVEHVQHPNQRPSTISYVNWNGLVLPPKKRPIPGMSNPGPSNPKLPTEPGDKAVTLPSESPDLGSPKELDDEVAQGSPPIPELTDPEFHLDQQSL
jgi:hypothetical protein